PHRRWGHLRTIPCSGLQPQAGCRESGTETLQRLATNRWTRLTLTRTGQADPRFVPTRSFTVSWKEWLPGPVSRLRVVASTLHESPVPERRFRSVWQTAHRTGCRIAESATGAEQNSSILSPRPSRDPMAATDRSAARPSP